MDVALGDGLWVLGLGVGLGVQPFRLLICLLLIDLVLVVIIRPCCLKRRPSLLVFESVKNFILLLKFFLKKTFDEELVKITRKNEIVRVKLKCQATELSTQPKDNDDDDTSLEPQGL